jgi:hypothetical protein
VRALIMLLAASAAWACARPAPAPAAAAAAAPKLPPATAEACRACRGEWGVHGLAGVPSCNCRTTDAGKRCTDGNECQGMCVAAPEDPEREVVEAGPPARGFFVGRCSELKTVYGCNHLIERGARARGPVPLADPPVMMCVD